MIQYRFKTKSVEDFRPLVDMAEIRMPWWCTGVGFDDEGNTDHAIIVCYLPEGIDLKYYWDDAYDIDCKQVEEIRYTTRFPKPAWLK